jgi:tetratricopeptide (TPR) repeat protein
MSSKLPVLPTIFISYSHKDEVWKDRLVTHLAGLEQTGRLRTWNDRLIRTGQIWLEEIEAAMEQASVAVLLISPDFLASKFIQTREVPRLLERRAKEGVHIVPVIVKDCLWEEEVRISSLQLLPQDGRALESFSPSKRNTELKKVAKKILDLLPGEALEAGGGPDPIRQFSSPELTGKPSPRRRFAHRISACSVLLLLMASVALISAEWVREAVLGKLMESQRRDAGSHLMRAARYLGDLGDVCLYREPVNKDEEAILSLRLQKAQAEVAAARGSLRWVLWGKDELEVRIYQIEAEIWLFRERYEDALNSIERGLRIDADHVDLIIDKAEALRGLGDVPTAERELSKAYERAARQPRTQAAEDAVVCAAISLALLRAELGEALFPPGSIEPLHKDALRRRPMSFMAQWSYGDFLYKQDRLEEGLKYAAGAYRQDRFDAKNGLLLAELYQRIAESEAASKHDRTAIKNYRKARLYYEKGFESAKHLSKPIDDIAMLYVNFGKTLFHLGYIEDAREKTATSRRSNTLRGTMPGSRTAIFICLRSIHA